MSQYAKEPQSTLAHCAVLHLSKVDCKATTSVCVCRQAAAVRPFAGSVLDGPVRAQQTDSLHSCIRTNASLTGVVAAVVVITHKRVEYLNMCLESVLEVHARQLDNRCAISSWRGIGTAYK